MDGEEIRFDESAAAEGIEVLDGEIVVQATALEPARPVERALTRVSPPVLQAAAAAAAGFVAGAAMLVLLRRYAGRAARDAELVADGRSRRQEPLSVRRGATYLVQVRQIVPPRE